MPGVKTTSPSQKAKPTPASSLQLTIAERFQAALFISAVVHATILLGVQFQAPKVGSKPPSALNVVLVNSKSQTRPDDPQALAQANLDGGGNTDQERSAKSPVPLQDKAGKDLAMPAPRASTPAKPSRRAPEELAQTPAASTPVAVAANEAAVTPAATTPVAPEDQPRTPLKQPPPQQHVENQSEASTESVPPPMKIEASPELQALAEAEAKARERAEALEREARELMTQLQAQQEVEQPPTQITVAPDYQPRPSPMPQPDHTVVSPPSATNTPPPANQVRVVKVEPQQAATATPSITAPPKSEIKKSAEPKPVAVNPERAGAQVLQGRTSEKEDVAEVATPKLRPSLTLPRPAETAKPAPEVELQVEVAKPEPAKVEPAKPEAPLVKVEPRLVAQAEPTQPRLETKLEQAAEPAKPAVPNVSELMRRSSEIARLEAQISKDWDQYQKRPRRKFIGARTSEYRYARYIEEWRTKVERVGNLNYPEAARQRQLRGSLQLTVAIKADGTVDSVEINRSSGEKVLDAAALRIVELAAPYAHFTPDIAKDTDILHITRTWTFSRDQLSSE